MGLIWRRETRRGTPTGDREAVRKFKNLGRDCIVSVLACLFSQVRMLSPDFLLELSLETLVQAAVHGPADQAGY